MCKGNKGTGQRYDRALEVDNNLVENAIRPTKLGAKNYLFFGSAEAGVPSALLYTLMENCTLNRLDPERYLEDVIRELPAKPTAEQVAALTPRRYALRGREREQEQAEAAAAAA